MAKNKTKQQNMSKPIENHSTAAWANIKETKNVSQVPIPTELEVSNAKEYVDSN